MYLQLSAAPVIKSHCLIDCKNYARQITATLQLQRRRFPLAMAAANREDQAVLMGTGVHIAAAQDDSRQQAGSRFRRWAHRSLSPASVTTPASRCTIANLNH